MSAEPRSTAAQGGVNPRSTVSAPNVITAMRNGITSRSGRISQPMPRARRQVTNAAARMKGVVSAAIRRWVYSMMALICSGGTARP